MEQTFLLTITGAENGEWQGRITGQSARPAEFESVMELLKFIKKELEKSK
ncbi:hypothetical protein [Oscillibacter sp.]